MSISEEKALELLQELVDQIEHLKTTRAFSQDHSRWLMNAFEITKQVFGPGSAVVRNLAGLPWRRQGSFIVDPWEHGGASYDEISESIHHRAYLEQLGTAKGILMSSIDQIRLLGVDAVHDAKDTNEIVKLIDLAESKLRKVMRDEPKEEKDIQDKFEELLLANDIRYVREQEKIVYSSKAYHPDFCFQRINTVLEIKLCGKEGREKEIIAEINDDILAYGSKYANIIFVVYDLGYIRDKDRFKEDIEAAGQVVILIVKH